MKVAFHAICGVLLTLALTACQKKDVTVKCAPYTLRLQVISPEIIRVSASADGKFTDRQSLVVLPQETRAPFEVSDAMGKVHLTTEKLAVDIYKASGEINFYKADGTPLALGGYARLVPYGDRWSTTLTFDSPTDEAFYGLGQHQAGEFDHKGRQEELYQYNTKVSVPMVVSSKGYGLLFDAYSLSRWGTDQAYKQLGEVFDLQLKGTYTTKSGVLVQQEDSLFYENEFAIKNLPQVPLQGAKVTYEGTITAHETGDYHFIQYYAGFQSTTIGGQEVMSRRWRPAWNPNSYKYTVHLEAGVPTPIRIDWEPDGDVSYIGLRAQPFGAVQEDKFTFWSECEPQLDYYFMGGDSYDAVIKAYRQLTGKAPVMPKWVLGFWQSRERYATQEDLVETLKELRARHIPVDNIVQDWQYWEDDQWGSHAFDTSRFPAPEQMLDDVHALHGRFMISVWPKFYTNTEHYKELKDAGYMYLHPEQDSLKDWLGYTQSFYDAYAAGGRKLFWQQMDESLYTRYGRKIDAWWMDASEPNLRDCLPLDYMKWLLNPNELGTSTEYLNAYALVNAQAIYEGQRGVDPDKRVFLLTRNGFAGLQRYSTATWSGDIGTSWTDMRMQMAAGLNYSMSGIPFWGMDIGGFSVMSKFNDAAGQDEWQELQTRWHQFGTFVPLFRTHGQWPRRELWNIAPEGSKAYESILWYMQLRYRLMPYLYSLTGAVNYADYTLMRGLPMDFPEDPQVRDLSDQWLLGPALMPCPVYEYKARSREVYFPAGGWYDFYTGEKIPGQAGNDGVDAASCPTRSGIWRTVEAPYERMPLYVRAGSIVPVGPAMEWSDQKPADNLLLLVYAGADAHFTLYEDDGLTYGYERGEYSTIDLDWDNAARTLSIGERKGTYPGMLQKRQFRLIFVDDAHPFAWDPDAPGRSVQYDGQALTIKL